MTKSQPVEQKLPTIVEKKDVNLFEEETLAA